MEIGRIVPTPSESSWSQIFSLEFEVDDREAQRPRLVAVVEMAAPPEFDLSLIGKEAFATLDKILRKPYEGIFSKLNQGVSEVKKVFERKFLLAGVPELVSYSLVVAVLEQEKVYLGQVGGATAGLWRKGRFFVVLTKGLEGRVVSGRLRPGDILVLASSAFVNAVSRGEVVASLASGDPIDAVDSLAPKIHGGEIDGQAAAAFVRVESSDLYPKSQEENAVFPKVKGCFFRLPPIPPTLRLLLARTKSLARGLWLREGEALPLYVQKEDKGVKGRLKLIIFILSAFLVVSLWQGVNRRRVNSQQATIDELTGTASQKYREALSLVELNPARSRDLLNETQSLLKRARGLPLGKIGFSLPWFTPQLDYQKVIEMENKITNLLMEVSQAFEVEIKTLVDLSTISSEARGTTLSSALGKVLALDAEHGKIYQIDIDNKEGEEMVSRETLKNAVDIDGSYVLTKEAIFEVSYSGDLIQKVGSFDLWQDPKALGTFGANLYVLDPGSQQIYKYLGVEGYSVSQHYLQDESVSLTQVGDMAINGRIWLISSTGEITPLLNGKAQVFVLSGLDQSLSSGARIFTTPGLEFLYVLDRGNTRLVIFDKTGEYQKQFLASDLGEATDLVVNEEETSAYLIVGSKVGELDLSNHEGD
jgi:hypothetical protein